MVVVVVDVVVMERLEAIMRICKLEALDSNNKVAVVVEEEVDFSNNNKVSNNLVEVQ